MWKPEGLVAQRIAYLRRGGRQQLHCHVQCDGDEEERLQELRGLQHRRLGEQLGGYDDREVHGEDVLQNGIN